MKHVYSRKTLFAIALETKRDTKLLPRFRFEQWHAPYRQNSEDQSNQSNHISLYWNNEIQTNENTNETLGNKLHFKVFSCCLSQFLFVCNSITLVVFIYSFWQSLKRNLFYFLSDIFALVCHSLFVYYRWPKCAALILLLIYYGLCRVMWRVRCLSPSECTASDKL